MSWEKTMRDPRKINKRRRIAEWIEAMPERKFLCKAAPDTKWALAKEWQLLGVSVDEIAQRLGYRSRGGIQHLLGDPLPPSMRKKNVPPPIKESVKADIDARRKLVEKIARLTAGHGADTHCKFPTATMIAVEMQRRLRAPEPWSSMTVHRDLEAMGYSSKVRPFASKARGEYDPAKRLAAVTHLLNNVDCRWLVFSDEKYFDSNDHGNRSQYCKGKERPYPRKHTQHCTTAHFWGAIGVGFRLLIEFGPSYGGLKAKSSDFIDVVLEKYVEKMKQPQNLGKPYILQQDGLGIHVSYESLGYLDDESIDHLKRGEWPAWSPDLSPIENVWEAMHFAMKSMEKKSGLSEEGKKAELSRHAWAAWNGIPQSVLDKYVLSAPKRFLDCQASGGEWTDH